MMSRYKFLRSCDILLGFLIDIMKNSLAIIIRFFTFIIAFTAMINAYAFNLDSLSEGQLAFDAGDYDKAVALWRSLALQGNSEAQLFMGLAFANGWGVKKDMNQAAMWYHIAAENENASGQFLLGLHYIASKNDTLMDIGIMWLQRAEKNGDVSAQRFLQKARDKSWFLISEPMQIGEKTAKSMLKSVKNPTSKKEGSS